MSTDGEFDVPIAEVPSIIDRELEGTTDPVVRIGDGARLRGGRIVDGIEDVPIELVDETGTTPYQGQGVRGMGDVLAAVNIARIEGVEIESKDVEPTAGELRTIQSRSREHGDDRRAIDEGLARKVALGELSMAEALDRHGGDRDSR